MASLKFMSFIVSCSIMIAASNAARVIPPGAIAGAYYPSWFQSSFPPTAIDTALFTHIYYAFLLPNNVTFEFEVPDSTAVALLNFTTTLHHKKPQVKTLISIAGGGADPRLFARMASEANSRKVFINSAMEVARKFRFDGLDLDWEFPQNPKEMQDLGLLFQEWRVAIRNEAKSTNKPPLLLTAAVYFSVEFLWSAVYRKFPVAAMEQSLDLINVMCYDYRGSWDTSATGAHAALYDPKSNISTSYGLNSWISAGMPRHKIVMGLPLYGRTWQLKDPNVNGIGAAAVAVGPGNVGVLTFSQVEKFNKENGATVVYDEKTVSTYSYSGTSWIGYDDTSSTTTKIRFAKALWLRGYFFWALSYDNEWEISRQALKAMGCC
ncbi:chitinase, putative [Ricinus communis]|uniref:Chitinase, putative n=1 Tax=Ricinus communis TaxID=3988 RepID=B9SC02_RICCO|nr:chitinase, putative [Ricinus communis]|eukprot:XP_002523521.1 class V chitinase [Ricinus communis]